jgi:hypothetical protein
MCALSFFFFFFLKPNLCKTLTELPDFTYMNLIAVYSFDLWQQPSVQLLTLFSQEILLTVYGEHQRVSIYHAFLWQIFVLDV